MHYYEVAPLSKARRGAYTYSSEVSLATGTVVEISFGSRHLHGIVMGEGPSHSGAKPITAATGVRLTSVQLKLARWLADEYLTPLGVCLRIFLNTHVVRHGSGVPDLEEKTVMSAPVPEVITQPFRYEAYLERIRSARLTEKPVLIIVPEILDIARFQPKLLEEFPELEVWHSRLPLRVRGELWIRVARGESKIILATRSALLLPWRTLGLVIVDDENDLAYKQEQAPRYHARALARTVSALYGSALIYGSSAPSFEVYRPVTEGSYKPPEPHTLRSTIRMARDDTGTYGNVPHELSEAVRHAQRSHQGLVIYAPSRFQGILADTLTKDFDGLRLEILGTDDRKDTSTIQAFKDGALAVLLGGQQLGKDWGLKTSVLFMYAADTLLQLPDFRAGEKAHALARKLQVQIADEGQFIIHTATADHPAWTMLSRPYERWVSTELRERQALKLPPYFRLTRILFTGKSEDEVIQQAREAETKLQALEGLEVHAGPSPVPQRGQDWRWHVLVKGDPKILRGHLDESWTVDVDPGSLL